MLGVVTLTVVLIALAGGFVVTQSAIAPIRRLTRAVARIISTGRTDERVPLSGDGTDDAIDQLTRLFNAMLDKIEGLVTAMRGALDNVSHDLQDATDAAARHRGDGARIAARPRSLPRGARRLRRGIRPRAGHAQHPDGHLRGRKRRDAPAPRAGPARRSRRPRRGSLPRRGGGEGDRAHGAHAAPTSSSRRTAPGSNRSPPT